MSDVFGEDTFLVTVQAHSLWTANSPESPDNWTRTGPTHNGWSNVADGIPDWMNKREGGQLILVKIPE